MSRLLRRRPRAAPPLGSWLLGSPDEVRHRQRLRLRILLAVVFITTNGIGAAVVFLLVSIVIPGRDLMASEFDTMNHVVLPIYLVLAAGVGGTAAARIGINSAGWVADGREPTQRERTAALALPWRLTILQGSLWLGGVVVVGITAATVDPEAVPKVSFTTLFGGITVCAFSYILTEFILRAVAARALEAGPDLRRNRLARVTERTLLAWCLGTGAPVTGLMLVAVFSFRQDVSASQLAIAVLALGSITLIFGFALTFLGARQITDPLRSVIDAMAKIEHDEFPGSVVVYDGSELGALQSGFNRMAEGLRERERIRDLFGRQVGLEVAEAALARNPELGGEERYVAVMFIDIVGSTKLAASRPPREVVDLLNRFFDVVVSEVDRHAGIINKFEGDAALAVFGAPVELTDAAGRAMATARAVQRRLPDEVPDCTAAIGVGYGLGVAGNIGARNRFEYTVIGDAVNEAARLCELAKQHPGLVLASDRALEAAGAEEAERWCLGEEVQLRGRNLNTRLAAPRQHHTRAG
ncbi:adenylate/guanylate cyclase domain-containing protein [Aldersonia sp. NBC_00410]|uniref:adenylate/guanylate cyclase domain-containing protein n=1 Tax=Aldersonia sp. NBC_00410 TaxID=2975954 RepID=UPI002256DA74|nr:adenylate/guanylate cyclase domain-containing protein [Aldersonia sp. NBC_00410]MCX5042912.1 adenylate/guanylate cyclase domain-containing protein [Aldersonia sp. NBC_00410]